MSQAQCTSFILIHTSDVIDGQPRRVSVDVNSIREVSAAKDDAGLFTYVGVVQGITPSNYRATETFDEVMERIAIAQAFTQSGVQEVAVAVAGGDGR